MAFERVRSRLASAVLAAVIMLQLPVSGVCAFAEEADSDNSALPVQRALRYDLTDTSNQQALPKGSNGGAPVMFLGYTGVLVLTRSMQEVYPQGSLVLVRHIDPSEIEPGDDITFMTDDKTSVTHRVVAVAEDYEGSGYRAFKTWGVSNAKPDNEWTVEPNVVGKVIFCSPALGAIVGFLKRFWPLVLFLIALAIGLKAYLKRICSEKEIGDRERREPPELSAANKAGARAVPAPR